MEARIAIATGRPKFYYRIARELKDLNVAFLSLSPGEEVPEGVKAVITSVEERGRVKANNVIASHDAFEAVGEALRAARELGKSYEVLVVGIDPGPRPGIAVVGDKNVLEVDRLASPEDTPTFLRDILSRYQAKKIFVRIGHGGGALRERIIKTIQENFKLALEDVDETSTTPSVGRDLNMSQVKDIVAAINIALKNGRPIKRRITPLPKGGEIRNIQKESRLLSGNLTISRELAERVARGELTLEEAIAEQKSS